MEKLEMEKVISGLLTVNGCDPERDTYQALSRKPQSTSVACG